MEKNTGMGYPKPPKKKKNDRVQSKNRKNCLQELEDREIHGCEVCLLEYEEGKRTAPKKGCFPLDPAHRHERDVYFEGKRNGEQLWIVNQVIIAGRAHHNELDYPTNREWREEVFQKLRGDDELKN